MKTLYDVLDVRADDDAESVRKAFRKAVKANHPDLNAGDPDAQSRHAQIIRANTILRDPQLRAIYDRMLEFEEQQQHRPQSKLAAIANTAYAVAAHTIFACVLAFVLAGGAYKLFTYVSETSDVTARASVTAAAVPPPAPVEAAGPPKVAAAEHPKVAAAEHPKAAGLKKPYAAALGAPVDVTADVKTAVDAALGRPQAAAAPPPPRPVIAGERHDEPKGAEAVPSNGQTPTANSHEALLLAGRADGTRSPDKRLEDTRSVQLDASTPATPPLDRAIQPLDSEQAATLLQRGRELLRTGDIAGARLAFQALADAGNVEAVLALGKTFDPRYLAQHYVVGVVGDEAKARAWYQRAVELGSTEAKGILAQMATK